MKRKLTWVGLLFILLAGVAYSQNTLTKRLIGNLDIAWSTGGTGAAEVFTYTTPQGYVLSLNKLDATQLKYRAYSGGNSLPVENSATADKVPEAQTYASLSAAVTALGSTQSTLKLLPGNYPVSSDLTTPVNVTIKPERGAIFSIATGKTLTINGPIEAGPWQIFSWTGTGAIALSSCPNREYPLEWMGGLPDGTDIAAALTKYAASFAGTRRFVKLGQKIYTLKTPVAITTSPQSLNIIGSGYHDSQILTDMDASEVGITIGTTSYWAYSLTMKDFSFTGAAGSCLTALKISQASPANLDLNFWCGSAGYVCWIENCVWMDAKIYLRNHLVQGYGGYGEPAKGLYLTNDASVGGANASRLYFDSEAFGVNPALEISPYYAGGGGSCGGLEITGCAENWTGSPIIIDGKGVTSYAGSQNLYLTFRNFYIETSDGNVGGTIPISNAALMDLSGLIVNDGKCQVQLSYTKHVTANPPAYFAGGLTIAPDCQATNIGPVVAETLFEDYAGDTIYSGGPSSAGGFANHQPFGAGSQDPTNYMYNSQLTRWQTSVMGGGWGAAGGTAYTKETGTVHVLPTSAKMVNSSGADAYTTCNLDAYQLQQFKGKYVTFSSNLFLKSTDVYSDNPYLQLYFSCAARVDSTAYELGEGITVGGITYVCVQAGTSDSSAPAFDDDDGHTTTDGGVIWRAGMVAASNNPIYNQITMTPGKWYPYMVGAFCPRNATAGACVIAQRPQTGGGNGTMYLAEPALMIGRQSPRSYVPNNPQEVLIGAIKVDSGTAPPGASTGWHCVGDIRWNTAAATGGIPGWYCITAGADATAVWQKMAAIAPLP